MLIENKRFRLYRNEQWSHKLTRYELIKELEKSCIERSWNWPYSLKVGKERKVKNVFGKILIVRKEFSWTEEEARKKYGQDIPYKIQWP